MNIYINIIHVYRKQSPKTKQTQIVKMDDTRFFFVYVEIEYE